jgi:lipoate-protein ligase A
LEQWRFIDSGPLDGFDNMAIDTALACAYRGVPVLRVYGWKPPAISLGHHQRLHDLDLDRCSRDGIDVVYRPTGGRAVLHADEVTYAVILGPESRLYDTRVLPVYERISAGLMAALALLGIPLDFERTARASSQQDKSGLARLCFASSIQYEIGHAGKKMIGSAQRRYGTTVLQHGSILLGGAHLQLVDYLAQRDENWQVQARRFMQEKTVCLNDISPLPLEYSRVAAALRSGFAADWGITFSDAELSEEEQALAGSLRIRYEEKRAGSGHCG